MVEMVVCTILLSVVAVVLVPGVHAVHAQRKETRFETLTLLELNNLAAKLPHVDDPAELKLSESFTSRYAEAELQLEPGQRDDASLLPVRITIRRPNGESRPDTSRSLVVWISDASDRVEKESSE